MTIINWVDLKSEALLEAVNNLDPKSVKQLTFSPDVIRHRLQGYVGDGLPNSKVYETALKHLEEIVGRKNKQLITKS